MMSYTFINQLPRQCGKGLDIKKAIEEYNKEMLNWYYTDCWRPTEFDPMCTGMPLIMTKLPSWCYYNNMTLENFITLWINRRDYNDIPKVPNVNMTKNRRIYDLDSISQKDQSNKAIVYQYCGEKEYPI